MVVCIFRGLILLHLPLTRIYKNPFVLFWSTENLNHTVNTDTNRTLRFRPLLCCTSFSVKHDLMIRVCLCFRTDKIPAAQYSAYVEACQRQRQENSGYLMSRMLCVVLLLRLLSIHNTHHYINDTKLFGMKWKWSLCVSNCVVYPQRRGHRVYRKMMVTLWMC